MKVSILIPCHDEEASIAACIDACLDQTWPPDEIVDDDDVIGVNYFNCR